MANKEQYEAFCQDLASIIEGDAQALARHASTLADSDEARDLRHDADRIARELYVTGADYVAPHPDHLVAKLLAAVDQMPAPQASPAISGVSHVAAEPAPTTQHATTPGNAFQASAILAAAQAQSAQSAQPAAPSQPEPAVNAFAATQLTPAQPMPIAPSPAPIAIVQAPVAPPAAQAASTAQSTAPATPRAMEPAPSSQAFTQPTPVVYVPPPAVKVRDRARQDAPSHSGHTPAPHSSSQTQSQSGGKVIRPKRWALIGTGLIAVLAAAAAAAIAFWPDGSATTENGPVAAGTGAPGDTPRAWGGRIEQVSRAAAGGASGIEVQAPGASGFSPAAVGTIVAAGTAIRTDSRTRARLAFTDGTSVTLGHSTELRLNQASARHAIVERGALVADVRPMAEVGAPAVFDVPRGRVTVLGTRLSVTVGQDQTSVQVVHGHARIADSAGQVADVKTGQEGVIQTRGGVNVGQATGMADNTDWAEMSASRDGSPDVAVHGLGELRARRPGAQRDSEQALRLANHRVTVRIQGNVARTEIEEEFANDSNEQLEGTYRFPLPPNAQIARLALWVDDRLEEGAFVDRDRAANIWRGVIRNSTPRAQQQQREEFVWVPGPWEDPALLEWQRGGRFDLRIFPIPARGSRKVILAYTQVIEPQSNGSRRYVYPLPHDPGGTTRAGNFAVNVRVQGHDTATPVRAHNYNLQQNAQADTATLAFAQDNFVPAGDLVVEYQLPNRDAELRSWTFQPAVTAPTAATGALAPSMPAGTSSRAAPTDADAVMRQAAFDAARQADQSAPGFVLLAIRPELPPWTSPQPRDYAFVVDSSHSMRGERYSRSVVLVEQMVRQMDRRDRFVVVACDMTCRRQDGTLRSPSEAAATEARRFLESIEPGNASDVLAAVRGGAAALAGQTAPDRDLRIVMLSDGHATAGYREQSRIAAATTESMPRGATLTTVGIGGDADPVVLRTLARSGGGRFVPYVPGQRTSGAALAALESTYGTVLRDARIELPAGLSQVAPATLPTVRNGEELLVLARSNGDVTGEVRLTGKVGEQDWNDRYPVQLRMTSSEGNAFVPRLWAASRIEDLDGQDSVANRQQITYLSERYGVLSRYTSLLVLESAAMFRAFRVQRNDALVADWTGNTAATTSESTGLERQPEMDEASAPPMDIGALAGPMGGGTATTGSADLRSEGGSGGGGGYGGRGAGGMPAAAEAEAPAATSRPMRRSATIGDDSDGDFARGGESRERQREPSVAAAPRGDRAADTMARNRPNTPPMAAPPPAPPRPVGGVAQQPSWFPRPQTMPTMPPGRRRGGTWMRVVRVRVGDVNVAHGPTGSEAVAVERARTNLAQRPDSRDRHRALVRALAISGDADQAAVVATQWWERDRLDIDALARLADAEGIRGNVDRALRLQGSTLDVRADDAGLHQRMATAYERAARNEEACSHRITLAELQRSNADSQSAAARCLRSLGRNGEATRLVAAITDSAVRTRAEASSMNPPSSADTVRGDVVAEATWSAPVDLDVSIITPRGTRASWMGGLGTITARDARTIGREAVGVSRMGNGSYVIVISRPTDAQALAMGPITGTVVVRVMGERRTVPFTLTGQRAIVARGVIRTETRQVAAGW